MIGERLRLLRESKGMCQGESGTRSGLVPCYLSRVEIGHIVPALETWEKFAVALEAPPFPIFDKGKDPPKAPVVMRPPARRQRTSEGDNRRTKYLRQLSCCLAQMSDADRQILLALATKGANR